MGVRIVVVLQHDMAHVWGSDPNLGRKILSHMQGIHNYPGAEIEGGKVVEILDDNMQSLLAFDKYNVHKLAYKRCVPGQKTIAICLQLIGKAAQNFGFLLVSQRFRRGRCQKN